MEADAVGWLPAQEHHGENVGDTPTHVIFVEMKETRPPDVSTALGPQSE